MRFFRKLNTRSLLVISFLGMVSLPVLIGGLGLVQMSGLAGLTTKMYRHPLTVSNAVRDANLNIQRIRIIVSEFDSAEDANQTAFEAALERVGQAGAETDEQFKIIGERFLGDRARVDRARAAYEKWKITQKLILRHKFQGRTAAAREMLSGPEQRELDAAMRALTDFAANKAATFLADAGRTYRITAVILIVLVLVLGILSGLIARYVTVRVGRNLNRSVATINHTSGQIVRTVERQEESSSRQAAAIQEITVTVEELGRTAQLTAEQVQTVSRTLEESGRLSSDSKQQIERLLATMSDIRRQIDAVGERTARLGGFSERISGIAAVVSNLSEQTGMLALNAAIEAVRAGEHGRGFGVVADEIRKLADHSKESAREIAGQVEEVTREISGTAAAMREGQSMVESGADLAQGAGRAFSQLAESNDKVIEAVAGMNRSAREQSVAVGQVLGSLQQINEGARENADGLKRTRTDVGELVTSLSF